MAAKGGGGIQASEENSGKLLDSDGAGPDGVVNMRGGVCPVVDFYRLMDEGIFYYLMN